MPLITYIATVVSGALLKRNSCLDHSSDHCIRAEGCSYLIPHNPHHSTYSLLSAVGAISQLPQHQHQLSHLRGGGDSPIIPQHRLSSPHSRTLRLRLVLLALDLIQHSLRLIARNLRPLARARGALVRRSTLRGRGLVRCGAEGGKGIIVFDVEGARFWWGWGLGVLRGRARAASVGFGGLMLRR